ncbi:hypothetical protein ABFX02_14G321300 [Erythranthe guttata]
MENAAMEYSSTSVPPGFRFRPTEEELVGYYLSRKVNSLKIDLDVIIDIDLYRIEPWDIQERCKSGSVSEQNEWYFFSHKDRKYPTGTRTNRATAAGFWKATGRDKAVHSKEDKLIGMRKTLVYYEGRAPNGRKSDWIMHEYRIQASEHEPTQEEGWVVCRAFKKPSPSHKQGFEAWNNNTNYYAIRSSSSDITNYRHPSSFPSNTSTNLLIHKDDILDDLGLISNQSGASNSCTPVNINQPPLTIFPVDQSDNDLKTGVISRLEISQMVELPKLDSPSDDKISSFGDMSYSEWKSFDKLLDSTCTQVEEINAASSSYAYTNMHDNYHDLLDDHTHISHVLECFPHL